MYSHDSEHLILKLGLPCSNAAYINAKKVVQAHSLVVVPEELDAHQNEVEDKLLRLFLHVITEVAEKLVRLFTVLEVQME